MCVETRRQRVSSCLSGVAESRAHGNHPLQRRSGFEIDDAMIAVTIEQMSQIRKNSIIVRLPYWQARGLVWQI
jgi:hypothetical protein